MAKGRQIQAGRGGKGQSRGSSSRGGGQRGNAGGRNQARNSQRNGLRGSGRDGNREARGPRGNNKRGAGAGNNANVIEGRRAVAEALAAGIPIQKAFVQKTSTERGATRDDALTELIEELGAQGVEIEEVAGAVLNSMSSRGAHQGIAVRVQEYGYAGLSDIIRKAGTGDALVIVLDHVTDEGNFGAIVRSAEVVGAAGVVIPKNRSASVGVGAYKSSAGAVLHIPIAQVSNIASALDELKAAGFWVVGATEHAEESAWSAPIDGRVALVMGSEGDGISRLVLEKCDLTCRIPQRGVIESLNVAQATTVLAYEWARRTWGSEDATTEDTSFEFESEQPTFKFYDDEELPNG